MSRELGLTTTCPGFLLTPVGSDPFHERYGAHLSQDEVNELIAPPSESVDRVKAWLASHGIPEDNLSYSPAGDWVKVTVPVSLAEDMLDTVSSNFDSCCATC